MHFLPWKCPICHQAAEGTLETVFGLALIKFDDDDQAEYAGETQIDWNSQITCLNRDGKVMLQCPEGHRWQADRFEEDVPAAPSQPAETLDTLLTVAEGAGLQGEDLDDAVRELTDSIAADVNNSGLEGQLEYLGQEMGLQAVRKLLEELGAEPSKTARRGQGE